MANYAKVNNGIVEKVVVAEADFFSSFVGSSPGEWIETTTGNIGYTYDSVRDVFISPKPYDSWVLNEATNQWEAPVTYPADGEYYRWDEATTNWVEVIHLPGDKT